MGNISANLSGLRRKQILKALIAQMQDMAATPNLFGYNFETRLKERSTCKKKDSPPPPKKQKFSCQSHFSTPEEAVASRPEEDNGRSQSLPGSSQQRTSSSGSRQRPGQYLCTKSIEECTKHYCYQSVDRKGDIKAVSPEGTSLPACSGSLSTVQCILAMHHFRLMGSEHNTGLSTGIYVNSHSDTPP